jgi:hypothetical protein
MVKLLWLMGFKLQIAATEELFTLLNTSNGGFLLAGNSPLPA